MSKPIIFRMLQCIWVSSTLFKFEGVTTENELINVVVENMKNENMCDYLKSFVDFRAFSAEGKNFIFKNYKLIENNFETKVDGRFCLPHPYAGYTRINNYTTEGGEIVMDNAIERLTND